MAAERETEQYVPQQARPAGSTASSPPSGRSDAPAAGPHADQLALHVLPHSVEAEMCVLGSMMLDPDTIDVVVHILQSEDFYQPANRILYDVLVQMHDGHKPIDPVSLTEELGRDKVLDRVGGDEYLMNIIEGVPSTASAEYYARLVRDKALLRKLIGSTREVTADAYESADEPAEILDRAEAAIFEIASRQIGDHAVTLETLLEHTFETLSSRDGSALTGTATGYYKLDELTAGFQPGEMLILAARPSMGKTALALNMAEHMAVADGVPVAIFSLEMSKEQLALRFLASRAKYNSQKLRRGNISPEEWTHLQMAAGELEKAPVYVDDSADLSVLRLRAKARRLYAAHKVRCIFIDYLQLMTPSSFNRNDSRQQQVSDMSRGLKALARELNIPVVVLSQLNRGAEDREGHRPRMSDLRESGAIEQDADVVMLLHREDYYHKGESDYVPTGVTELIIAKQRNGPTDTIPLTFLPECIRFENFASDGGGYGY